MIRMFLLPSKVRCIRSGKYLSMTYSSNGIEISTAGFVCFIPRRFLHGVRGCGVYPDVLLLYYSSQVSLMVKARNARNFPEKTIEVNHLQIKDVIYLKMFEDYRAYGFYSYERNVIRENVGRTHFRG